MGARVHLAQREEEMNTSWRFPTMPASAYGPLIHSGNGIRPGPYACRDCGNEVAVPGVTSLVGSASGEQGGGADPQNIIVFYSSTGHGHISGALAIREEILNQDPTARVVLQDIRAFMHPVWRRIDERLYWFVANNLPEPIGSLFPCGLTSIREVKCLQEDVRFTLPAELTC